MHCASRRAVGTSEYGVRSTSKKGGSKEKGKKVKRRINVNSEKSKYGVQTATWERAAHAPDDDGSGDDDADALTFQLPVVFEVSPGRPGVVPEGKHGPRAWGISGIELRH